MRIIFISLVSLFICFNAFGQSDQVRVLSDESGHKLIVNGQPFMVNGMNWDYIPIGTNTVNAKFWDKPDEVIKAGLDAEMALLQNMNVNAIRQYTGVPARWIQYIYENYGIYTMLNHSFGRYGLTLNGVWTPVTDYSDPYTREFLLKEVQTLAQEYKNTPGLLMYLLGNENNYGLFWAGAETEDFPDDEKRIEFIGESRGRPMYNLMNEASKLLKSADANHPVAVCNGDVLFLDILAQECKDVDIYGTNTYRGVSFTDMFEQVKKKYGKPIMFTEFGADAFNAISLEEDQRSQAQYLLGNWKEIYANAAGYQGADNCIGGFTFQFTDGWWKYGFNDRAYADRHDNNASWANGGYPHDLEAGENNMNEEWFGIAAKGPTNALGLYTAYPRAAYYVLKDVHAFNPYASESSDKQLQTHLQGINIMNAVLQARGDKASIPAAEKNKIRISRLMGEFTTFNTGGTLTTTPTSSPPNNTSFPDEQGFDHMESYFIGVAGNPAPNMRAEVQLNILGNVAENPINEIFYENRGRRAQLSSPNGPVDIEDPNRVQIYNAEYEWNNKNFDLRGFYRTGHYHWAYEGDFFNLYPEANYGPNLDIYNGVILGAEVDGKKKLKDFKLAFGPQLWWGANPALLVKYHKEVGQYEFSGIFHEDVDNASDVVSSIAIPQPKTRRLSFGVKRNFGKVGLELGGLWGGQPLNGRKFQVTEGEPGNYTVYEDEVQATDNWGGKAKLTYTGGNFNAYMTGSAMGLVANGGADQTLTYTGWRLKDVGSGNMTNFLAGFTVQVGKLQIAPNFLWQKPIVGPMPNDVGGPGRLRNIFDDPFVVRANRETVGGEILFTFDPTPGTYMYEWNNDRMEDAPLAVSAGFVFRHHPTAQDAAIGFLDTRQSFAFPGSAPAQDLWEAHARIVSKISSDFGIIGNLYYGLAQANGSDDRLIRRGGGDVRAIYKKLKAVSHIKVNDWGPFDYHRDFNLTFPMQLMLDVSTTLGTPQFLQRFGSELGVRGTWRSLDQFSPRFSPNNSLPFATNPIISPVGFGNGSEWEIRTYLRVNIVQ